MDHEDNVKMLRICAEDPMHDRFSEVSKGLLNRSADEIELLREALDRARGALADISGAKDMTLQIAQSKAARIYAATKVYD